MPAGVSIRNKRKAGAFVGGELAAGEVGVNTALAGLAYSADGTAVLTVPRHGFTMGVVVHGATAGTARPTGYTVVFWFGSVQPTNMLTNDLYINTT
jgi:hypothetical protein